MKFTHILFVTALILCISSAYAATNNTHVSPFGSDNGHHVQSQVNGQATIITASQSSATMQTNAAMATNAIAFTSTPTTGTCLDNSKKIAVYMPALTNSVYSESTQKYSNLPIAFDPLTTAMLFEYKPDYLGDSSISSIKVANYGLLIVPMCQMSPSAATAINNYIASGGSVWFLNDPCMTTTGGSSIQLSTLLGTGVASSVSGSTTITVVNTDDITNGLSTSYKPVGTTTKSIELRKLPSTSGTISGLNYQVLMSSGTSAMLVKFENPTTGARVIYSNPNMFISGGTSSYFDAKTASKLFLQTKAWIMKLAQNPNGLEVTYPGSDKQLTVTIDDEEGMSWDLPLSPMFTAETNAGASPSAINTFFPIPTTGMDTTKMNYYAQNGDVHTLHPHYTTWDVAGTSATTYKGYITTDKGYINTAMGTSNYGFTAWRFPFTTFCTNSMQAVSDSGFTIESSWGDGTDSEQIGTTQDNTVLLPKQMLINNAKSNLIEMEILAGFDIDPSYTTGAKYASAYNAYTNQFKGINFPSNFVVGGHYQGIGVNCLKDWGVTSTGLSSGLGTIVSTQKTQANPKFSTFNTLANYLNNVRSAKISASVNGGVTTVTVTNSQPITGFTLKSAFGNIISATCDGVAVTPTTDSTTGAQYVTKDLTATTIAHTFVITTSAPAPVAPTISFTPQTQTINSGATASFSVTTTGSPAPSVSWVYGDGQIGTTASHIYTNTGTVAVPYTVIATATNSAGTATYTGTVTVNPATTNTAPTVSFTPKDQTIASGTTVNFVATISGNPTPTVAWTFGDGGTASGTSVSHLFTNTGTAAILLPVTAIATNSVDSISFVGAITVNPASSGGAPVASFTQSVASGSTPLVVTFTSTSSNNPTCTWDFGDGTPTATGNVVTHVFLSDSGSTAFTVTLTATNSVSSSTKTGTTTATAYVNPPSGAPSVYFTQSATSGTTATTFT